MIYEEEIIISSYRKLQNLIALPFTTTKSFIDISVKEVSVHVHEIEFRIYVSIELQKKW